MAVANNRIDRLYTENIYAGLWYPIIFAFITFVIGSLYLPETHGSKIWEEVKNLEVTQLKI
jgi:hypothetical protein